jgi:hypothetical protein
MKKRYTSIALLTILFSGLLFASFNLGTVSAANNVTGRINQDTTWTKTGSPYTLTGNLLVSTGVTLTIEAGVTVNLNSYLLMVNGTLQAKGSSSDKIQFNGGTLTVTQSSSGWNQQTGSGCVIENAIFNSATSVTLSGSPKINGCAFQGNLSMAGNTTFTNNTADKQVGISGSPTVTGNTFKSQVGLDSGIAVPVISYNTISGGLFIYYNAYSPKISHNTITGGLSVDSGQPITIESNEITGEVKISSNNATVSNNNIKGSVTTSASNIIISGNTISQTDVAISLIPTSPVGSIDAVISGNTINARQTGIIVSESMTVSFYGWYTKAVVSGNTFTGCANAGISVGGTSTQAGHEPGYNNITVLSNRFFGNNYAINSLGIGRIEGNVIVGNYFGISGGGPAINNVVANNTYGILSGIIEHNFVAKNKVGVMGYNITGNTIINNDVGILSAFGELHNNNIYGNTLNVNYTATTDGNATSNWWGTTDAVAIGQSIRDYEEDFLLGRVFYTPFLTALNQNAPSPNTEIPPIDSPIPTALPTPTQTAIQTANPTQTTVQTTNPTSTSTTNPTNSAPTTPQPTIPEFPITVPLLIAAIAAALLAAATIAKARRKQSRRNQ